MQQSNWRMMHGHACMHYSGKNPAFLGKEKHNRFRHGIARTMNDYLNMREKEMVQIQMNEKSQSQKG